MKIEMIDNVKVSYAAELTRDEAVEIVLAEIEAWEKTGKELASVDLKLDGDEIIIKATEKSPIRRVRRITGYLSNMENFNDAKQAELSQRYQHIRSGCRCD